MDRRVDALRGGIECRSRGGRLGVGDGETVGGGSVEHSFKNKGAAKTQALPLAPILLVQKSTCTGEAGVGEAVVAARTCKGSLTGGGVAPARPSDAQVSSLPQQEWSVRTENLAEF